NGVIVITTKRARSGEGTLTANLKTGSSRFNHGNFKLMNSQQIYDSFRQYKNQSAIPADITDALLQNDFNWIENGTQAVKMNDFNFSYVGNKKKTYEYFSVT